MEELRQNRDLHGAGLRYCEVCSGQEKPGESGGLSADGGWLTVSPGVTSAVQHVIRNAGFHVGTMPLVDMRNGGHGYILDARDAETGESWSVIADAEREAALRLAALSVQPRRCFALRCTGEPYRGQVRWV